MLTHPTLDQLKALNLDGMADAFVELQNQAQAAELSHAEWLALLLDREAANRNTRRFQIRLRSAKLRHSQAAIEDVDYRTPRRLDKALRSEEHTSELQSHVNLVGRLLLENKKTLQVLLDLKSTDANGSLHLDVVP